MPFDPEYYDRPMPALAEFIVSLLRSEGVRTIFGVPGGGGNLDLIEAARRIDLPFVLTATETGAVIAALAQAEISGAPGACLTTLGPGAASAVNGVACAFLERAPVFVFTDSLAAGADPFWHQRLDQQALFRSITKFSGSLAGDPAHTLGQAIAGVRGRPAGPVHIDCPGDLASIPAPKALLTGHVTGGATIAPDARAKMESLVRQARRPLVIAGLGARRADDVAAIRTLCERHSVPAMVTYKAKGVVPDDHPWFAGVFTNASLEKPIIDESDLILAAGLDPVELLPRPWSYSPPVLYCGDRLANGYGQMPVAATLTGISASLEDVRRDLAPASWDRGQIQDRVEAMRQAVDVPGEGLTSQDVVKIAAARLAPRCRVTVDAGAHMFAATWLWPVREPNQMLISNGLSTMGFALPAAISAALIERGAFASLASDTVRPVVALTGDGGLLMCAGELLTAVRERTKIIVIVFSDASLSLIEIKQQARRLAPKGVALGAIDWPKLAGGFGVPAWAAANGIELEAAIERASHADGPCLIEAKIDRSNYGATLKAIRG